MSLRTFAMTTALICLPALAPAGPVSDFEGALRDAYGQYRAALFQSNSGNAEATTAAMKALSEKWSGLERQWAASPPPHYSDDAGFGATLMAVDGLITTASGQVTEGKLPEAHETLEGIRAQIGDLHLRNGMFTFSDRMNAYHAEMEHVLTAGVPADGQMTGLAQSAGVLRYLADDIAAHPAPEAADPAYAGLLNGFMASVQALQTAVEAGDAAAAKAAVDNLKVPYSKLFAKFG